MKPYILFTAIALFGGISLIGAVSKADADATQDFITKVTIATEFEIESSKLALDKSQNKDVKRFAQQMIDDHTKANDQLISVLQSQKVESPKEELDSDHQKMMNKLQGLSGDDFNHAYVSMQVDAHKDAVKLFSGYSKHGDNAAIKDFATQTLPTLQSHLEHAQKLSPDNGL